MYRLSDRCARGRKLVALLSLANDPLFCKDSTTLTTVNCTAGDATDVRYPPELTICASSRTPFSVLLTFEPTMTIVVVPVIVMSVLRSGNVAPPVRTIWTGELALDIS